MPDSEAKNISFIKLLFKRGEDSIPQQNNFIKLMWRDVYDDSDDSDDIDWITELEIRF